MATATTKKLSDLFQFNQITNPGGAFNTSASTPAIGTKIAPIAPTPALNKNVPSSLSQLSLTPPPAPGINLPPNSPLAGIGTKTAIAPAGAVTPVTPAPAPQTLSATYAGPSGAPQNPVIPPQQPLGSIAATGATGPSPVPQSWMNADGSFKTPDQVAHEVGTSLAAAHGNGDVGRLAAEQFGAGPATTADAEAQARRINNTKNDISVGATDPYGVGASSGIAYTPEELSAIEKSYAGIYTPALDTALAKVTDKQAADKVAQEAAANVAAIKAQGEQTRATQENAPYTLGPAEVRYDGQGNPISSGAGAGNTTYTPGQDPSADAWIEYVRNGGQINSVPIQYQNIVAQGLTLAASGKAALSPTSVNALGIINQLNTLPNLGALSGTGFIGSIEHPSSLFPGTDVQTTQNLAKQLQSTISLSNRQQLKGQGAISDFEFRTLGDAATALGLDENGRTNLSSDEFKRQLSHLALKLQVGPTQLTDDQIQYLNSPAGGNYTPEQIRAYGAATAGSPATAQPSFSSVGNTKASTSNQVSLNRPQRNNNPGDVKAGGLADSLAVGTDNEGHLIFKTPTDGFKALTADVTAKINGASKYLPSNPTISQLGSVYAQDPNWGARVAAIVGVPASTPTQSIPLDKLVKAIATQEGYYA